MFKAISEILTAEIIAEIEFDWLLEHNSQSYHKIKCLLQNDSARTSEMAVLYDHMRCIVTVVTQIQEYSLVSFTPLDISDDESVGNVLLTVDMTIQYGEDYDVHIPKVY